MPNEIWLSDYGYTSCAELGTHGQHSNGTGCPMDDSQTPTRPYPLASKTIGPSICNPNITDPYPWTVKVRRAQCLHHEMRALYFLRLLCMHMYAQDAIFDCNQLPPCEITCPGPNPDIIKMWSRHCACTFEWSVHGHVLCTIISVLVYTFMNISRWEAVYLS